MSHFGLLMKPHPRRIYLFCISPFTLASTVNNRAELWRNAYFNRTFHWISSNPKELSFFLSRGGRNITENGAKRHNQNWTISHRWRG